MSKEFTKNMLKNNKLLLFARADHPEGYGAADGTAHGYVVIAVLCKEENVNKVIDKLVYHVWEGLDQKDGKYYEGHLGDWYGGKFDLLAMFDGVGALEYSDRFRSLGDNRYFGLYTDEEVLNSDSP
jgi:hypothetical protein